MMKYTFLILMAALSVEAFGAYTLEDVKKVQNDKEVIISSFNSRTKKKIQAKYKDEAEVNKRIDTFYNLFLTFLNSEKKDCELRLIKELQAGLSQEGLASNEEDLEEYFKVLRVNHAIDDILYEMLSESNHDYFELQKLNLSKKAKRLRGNAKLLEQNDLEEIFAGFKTFPDEEKACLYREYNIALNHVRDEKGERKYDVKDFRKLTLKAFEAELIDRATYHRLIYLQEDSKINKRFIWLNDYLKTTFNAKNMMVPVNLVYKTSKIEDEDDFASERIKRFSRITRRKLLYRKYNETQIILLAQVLQKASRRMGVDPDTESKRPYISQEFTIINSEGERENYVETFELDPQSQYNLARRLLRKDIVDLQMMDIFVKQKITHEDVVMAALETGYISLEDLEYVVKYDDLWNPNISKFEKITGFIFTIAGYSTFFLPPPWNITASIALGVVEGVVNNKFRTGAENDNPATFIE